MLFTVNCVLCTVCTVLHALYSGVRSFTDLMSVWGVWVHGWVYILHTPNMNIFVTCQVAHVCKSVGHYPKHSDRIQPRDPGSPGRCVIRESGHGVHVHDSRPHDMMYILAGQMYQPACNQASLRLSPRSPPRAERQHGVGIGQ